jgi:hypothetical protein
LVHAPIEGRRLGFIGARGDFVQNLVAQGQDLGFGFGQRGVQPPLNRPPMRDASKPNAWRSVASLLKSVANS